MCDDDFAFCRLLVRSRQAPVGWNNKMGSPCSLVSWPLDHIANQIRMMRVLFLMVVGGLVGIKMIFVKNIEKTSCWLTYTLQSYCTHSTYHNHAHKQVRLISLLPHGEIPLGFPIPPCHRRTKQATGWMDLGGGCSSQNSDIFAPSSS